jgi:chromosome segregation ATPase
MAKETITQQRDRYKAKVETLEQDLTEANDRFVEAVELIADAQATGSHCLKALQKTTELNHLLVERVEIDARIASLGFEIRDFEDELDPYHELP